MTQNVLTTLSLGCGVQSSTIAEMIVEGELPPVDYAIFADTGDEPGYVYKQRDYLVGRLASVGIPLVTVHKADIIERIMSAHGRFASIPAYTRTKAPIYDGYWEPYITNQGEWDEEWVQVGDDPIGEKESVGQMRRQCTREYKIEAIEKFIRKTMLDRGHAREYSNGAIHVNKGLGITSWLGISLDEATRMKTNKVKWITNEWPLIEMRMSRLDCVNWLKEKGLPLPRKSSCRICPFHNSRTWKDMKDNRPEDWAHVVKVDEFLRTSKRFTAAMKGAMYLHRDAVPLKDAELDDNPGQMEMFDECDEGYCFI